MTVAMLRIGVDLIEVERVERAMNRHGERFYRRFFTERERAQCGGLAAKLAARFAAKEAAAKALGCGIGVVSWTDIEIESEESGRPRLMLHGAARERAAALGLTQWEVSLSHTHEHAIAFVTALGGPDALR